MPHPLPLVVLCILLTACGATAPTARNPAEMDEVLRRLEGSQDLEACRELIARPDLRARDVLVQHLDQHLASLNGNHSVVVGAIILALAALDDPVAGAAVDTALAHPCVHWLDLPSMARHWDADPAVVSRLAARHPPRPSGDGLAAELEFIPDGSAAWQVRLHQRNAGPGPLAVYEPQVYLAMDLLAISADGAVSTGEIVAFYKLPPPRLRRLEPGEEVVHQDRFTLVPSSAKGRTTGWSARWQAERCLDGGDAILPLRGRGPWRISAEIWRPPGLGNGQPAPDPALGPVWSGRAISAPVMFTP